LGQINKHERNVPVVGKYERREEIHYCPDCEKQGLKSKLGLRILQKDEQRPPDYYQFRQCHICALILPIYELKKESKIKDTIETTRNPFDEKNLITPVHDPKTKTSRELEKLRERINSETDEVIKRELKQGNIVTIIEDSMDY
jgi:hypothetical protein